MNENVNTSIKHEAFLNKWEIQKLESIYIKIERFHQTYLSTNVQVSQIQDVKVKSLDYILCNSFILLSHHFIKFDL